MSLEKFEDVGVEKDKSKTYYQLKHTSKSTESKVERMRDRDTDLWKTLSMWVDKIKEGRDEDEQKKSLNSLRSTFMALLGQR